MNNSCIRSIRSLLLASSLALAAIPALARAQSYPPAFSASATYAVGDQVQLDGNVERAIKAVTKGAFKIADWELWDIRANTTIMIGSGQEFPSLTAAWTYIENARIAQGAYLHLYISTVKANFVESLAAQLSLNHPCGAQISILGDNEYNITLFTKGNGLEIDTAHGFGTISGLTLFSTNTGEAQGITAYGDASIYEITNVITSFYKTGVYATQGASLYLSNSVEFLGDTNGIVSDYGASVIAGGDSFITSAKQIGTALYANHNGTIQAEDCNIDTGGGTTGFEGGAWAENGGMIDVKSAAIYACTYGCEADNGAHIYYRGGFGEHNKWDATVQFGGTIDASGANLTDPTLMGSNDGSYIYK